jgi:hypothetical protein
MHTPTVRKKSVNWLRRFNQDQHGAGNVVTVFKLIQARCRTCQNLKYATPCPAAPPRQSMHAGQFKLVAQTANELGAGATGTRLPTRRNGNPPHATQIIIAFPEWYFSTPATVHYCMCVLSGCVPGKLPAFFYCSPLRLWEVLGCYSWCLFFPGP